MILLLVLALADPVAEARALADRDGIAAFDAILKTAVAEKNHRVQSDLLDVLASFGADAVPRVVALIMRGESRECAFMTLQKITRIDSAIPALVPLLGHENRSIQRVVRDGLKREAAIPALFAALTDTKLRNNARKILRTFGAKLKPHLSRHPDPAMRLQLVPLYAAAGELEQLAKWVRDPDVKVRLQVVAEFGRHDAKTALPVLTEALADKELRDQALIALAKLGKPAHPVLRKEIAKKDDAAVRALRYGGADALPLVEAALKDDALRPAAVFALRGIGVAALPIVLDLVPQLPPNTSYGILRRWKGNNLLRALATVLADDKSAARRRAAAWALGMFHKSRSVPALVKALDDTDPLVVNQVIWALGQIGSKAKDAIPALRAKEKDAAHRVMARDALKRIEG